MKYMYTGLFIPRVTPQCPPETLFMLEHVITASLLWPGTLCALLISYTFSASLLACVFLPPALLCCQHTADVPNSRGAVRSCTSAIPQ